MFQYSENNHYRWGWEGKDWLKYPDNIDTPFRFEIGRINRNIYSFRKECIIAAEKIANNTTKPIKLMLSGGLDSQVAFLSFIEAKVEFIPFIINWTDNFGKIINDHDTSAAYELCLRYNIAPKTYTTTWNTALEWIKTSKFPMKSFAIPASQYITHKFSDYCIVVGATPGDVIFYIPSLCSDDLIFAENCSQNGQYAINNNLEALMFFMYTPELFLSFIDNKSMHYFCKSLKTLSCSMTHYLNSNVWETGSHYLSGRFLNDWWKPLLYNEQWPELIQRVKYHGYEQAYTVDKSIFISYMRDILDKDAPIISKNSIKIKLTDLKEYMKHNAPSLNFI